MKTPPLRQPARHQVRDELVRMILEGELQPGQQLVQGQLAKQFGVAQGAVREALLELSFTGFVEAIDHRGAFVSGLKYQEVLDAYEIRAALESLAARTCCRRVSREQIQDLRDMLVHSCELARSGRTRETQIADRQFHQRIVELSGNQPLLRLTKSVWHLQIVLDLPFEPEQFCESHEEILNAVAEDRPDDAERLMRADVMLAQTIFREIAQKAHERLVVPECVGLVG